MSELIIPIKSIPLKGGLLGKKPTTLELYDNGIKLLFKTDQQEIPFEEISAIKSMNYGTPNPPQYDFDVYGKDGKKLVSFAIPFTQHDDAALLFRVHGQNILREGWRESLLTTTYVLDDYTTWRDGKLFMKWKKGIEEVPLSDITGWEMKHGSNYFTFEKCKLSGMIHLYDSPNCMATAEICRSIAELAK